MQRGHSEEVQSVSFSPDGKQIVSGSEDKTLKIWDAKTGKAVHTMRGHSDIVWSVSFSPDGKQIVSGSEDDTLKLWSWDAETKTGELLHTMEGRSFGVNSVSFSPDGKHIVSGSTGYDDSIFKLWDAKTGELRHTRLPI